MPTYTTTAKRALRWLQGGNLVSDIDAGFQALAEDVDAQFGSSGKSIIATAETRTNASYGALTTPDRVQNVVVASGDLLLIDFQALWKTSTSQGQAAIFIGSNQLKVQAAGSGLTYGPRVQAAQCVISSNYSPLISVPVGLAGVGGVASASASDVTTGQALGIVSTDYGKIMIDTVALDLAVATGGGGAADTGAFGGTCTVFGLAAGTYDVVVQFCSPGGGTVTAKERSLWVRVIPF